MMRPAVAVWLSVGLGCLACSGFGQSEEEAIGVLCSGATCEGCPTPDDPAFDAALAAHLTASVTHEETVASLVSLAEASDTERAKKLRAIGKKVGVDCALADVYTARAKSFNAQQVARLCALGSTCEQFDPADATTVVACAEEKLDPSFATEVARMNVSSPTGLAQNLEDFARKHTTSGCALALVLRGAQ